MQRHLAGAYRVFFNAEMENYFEVLARAIAKHAEDEWKIKGKTSRAFSALCSRNNGSIAMPQEISGIKSTSFLDRKFDKELQIIRKSINDNNGAKSHNILQMFVPLGVNESAIDPILLSECDTLGSGRGLLAHQTGGAAVHLIDPRTEYDQSLTIIALLDDFESGLEM